MFFRSKKVNSKSINDIFQIAINHHQNGELTQAEKLYKKILKQQPEHADTLNYFGVLNAQLGLYDAAIDLINKAISINKNIPDYYNNLGTVYYQQRCFSKAISAYEHAIYMNPGLIDAYFNLANSFFEQAQFQKAASNYKKTLELNTKHIDAKYNLANTYRELEQFDLAISTFENILQLEPKFAEVHNNLGRLIEEQGRFEDAIKYYKNALSIKNDFYQVHSSYLFCLNYCADVSQEEILNEHKKWQQQHASTKINSSEIFINDPDPNRKLKVGYVSPDFRTHSVAYFIEPVLNHHNHENIETFAYYSASQYDQITERIKHTVDNWRDIFNIDNKQVTELIREDKIDILIDLAGHSANNRLQIFASKSAPIQITYLGYPNTTGISEIDFRLTDNFADPSNLSSNYHSEELLYLPSNFLCYQPSTEYPEIRELPSLDSKLITFASFNNACKLNPVIIAIWSKIINKVSNSRLLLKIKHINDKTTRDYILKMFIAHNVPAEKIQFIGLVSSHTEHLEQYNSVDIALDTYPYNGTTTTFEALWMGVPVITLAGNVHRSRVGTSILNNIGYPEFIAETSEDFVDIAVNLANDSMKLKKIRNELRNKLKRSKLMNAKEFTDTLENIYREIWKQWCLKKLAT